MTVEQIKGVIFQTLEGHLRVDVEVDAGKVRLDESVRRHLPELPERFAPITIALLPPGQPARLLERLHAIDANQDGLVTRDEAKAAAGR